MAIKTIGIAAVLLSLGASVGAAAPPLTATEEAAEIAAGCWKISAGDRESEDLRRKIEGFTMTARCMEEAIVAQARAFRPTDRRGMEDDDILADLHQATASISDIYFLMHERQDQCRPRRCDAPLKYTPPIFGIYETMIREMIERRRAGGF